MLLNKVFLMGYVGCKPTIRSTSTGKRIADFRIAINDKYVDKNTNEEKGSTYWFTCVVYAERYVDLVEKYFDTGTMVLVEGQLSTRSYQTKTGENKTVTEILIKNDGHRLYLMPRASKDITRTYPDLPHRQSEPLNEVTIRDEKLELLRPYRDNEEFKLMDDDIPF